MRYMQRNGMLKEVPIKRGKVFKLLNAGVATLEGK